MNTTKLREELGESEETEHLIDWLLDAWETLKLLRERFGDERAMQLYTASPKVSGQALSQDWYAVWYAPRSQTHSERRRHYFTCTDQEPRQAFEQDLERLGERIPDEYFLMHIGLPYEHSARKALYRFSYLSGRRYQSRTTITFYAASEQEARGIAEWIKSKVKSHVEDDLRLVCDNIIG